MTASDSDLAVARKLHADLDAAFPMMDVRKALYICEGDAARAAQYLVDGKWRTAKLISWDHASLDEKSGRLAAEFAGCSPAHVREVLMDCAGSETLARRVLSKQPPLPSSAA